MAVMAVALLYAAVRRVSGPHAALLAGAALALTAGGGIDVSVQQSRRGDGAADDGGRLLRGARARARQCEVDRLGGGGIRLCVPGQDARGHHGDAGDRCRVSVRGADLDAARGCSICGCTGDVPGFGGLVRRADVGVAGVVAALHRGLDRQQLHEPGPGLQRSRPRPGPNTATPGRIPGRRSAGAHVGVARRPPRRVRRLRWPTTGLRRLFTGEFGFEIGWLLPAALLAWRWCSSRGDAPRAPTSSGRPRFCSAGGCSSTDWCSATWKTMIHPYYCLSLAPGRGGNLRRRRPRDVGQAIHVVRPTRTCRAHRVDRRLELVDPGPQCEWFPALRWVILAVTVRSASPSCSR